MRTRAPIYCPIKPQTVGFDPTNVGRRWTLSNGNISGEFLPPTGESNSTNIRSKRGRADKRYFEVLVSTMVVSSGDFRVGCCPAQFPNSSRIGDDFTVPLTGPTYYSVAMNNQGQILLHGSVVTTYATFTPLVLVLMALDAGTGNVWFGLGNVFNGNPSAGTGAACNIGYAGVPLFASVGVDNANSFGVAHDFITAGFTADQCFYPPPAGFTCWDD